MLSVAAASFVCGIAMVTALTAHHADFARPKSLHPHVDQATSTSAPFNVQSNYCRTVYSCTDRGHLSGNGTAMQLHPGSRSACHKIACSCGDHCHLFDACCHDHWRHDTTNVSSLPPTPLRHESSEEWEPSGRPPIPERLYSCRTAHLPDSEGLNRCGNQRSAVFVVSGCPATASDTLKSLCKRMPDKAEADVNFTVTTDSLTGVTYSNVHCAECWGVSPKMLVTWKWHLECVEPWASRLNKTSEVNGARFVNRVQEIALAATFLRTKCTLSYEPPPSIVDMLYLCPHDLVDDCPPGTSERAAAACTDGAAATAFFEGLPYRNVDCIRCWHDLSDSLPGVSCRAVADESSRGVLPQPEVLGPVSQSFSILLSPASDECPLASTPFEGVLNVAAAISGNKLQKRQLCDLIVRCLFISVGPSYGAEQVDPPCSVFCPGGEFVRGVGCRVHNSTRTCRYATTVEDGARIAAASGTVLSAIASGFVGNTLVVPVDDAIAVCFDCLSVSTYTRFKHLDNGTLIAWDGDEIGDDERSLVHQQPTYILDGLVANACILRPLTDDAGGGGGGVGGCVQLPDVVSIALIVVSEASIVIFVALYATVPALRRSPGYMVVSEAVAFFIGFLLFLLRPAAAEWHSFALCAATAAGAHYFLAAAFVWMALYASEIVRALSLRPNGGSGISSGGRTGTASLSSNCRHPFCFRGSSDSPRCLPRAVIYRLVGWGAPLALVAAGLSADALDTEWRPSYGPPHCFIRSRLGNRVLFVGPLCACVSLCVAIYAYMVVKLVSVLRQTAIARLHGSVGGIGNSEKLALVAKLALALGLLWTFAALAAFVESAELECTFVVLNSLQGAFLLAAHGSGREVRRQRWAAQCRWLCVPSRMSLSQCSSPCSSSSSGKRRFSITASTKTSSLAYSP